MNQWPFVLAAYAVMILTTLGLVIASWAAMRRAEADVDALQRR
jgi:Heme exporter protein D (CcmD)